MDELAVGSELPDFHRLSAAVEHFDHTHFVQFYKTDSRKIEADIRTRKHENILILYLIIKIKKTKLLHYT